MVSTTGDTVQPICPGCAWLCCVLNGDLEKIGSLFPEVSGTDQRGLTVPGILACSVADVPRGRNSEGRLTGFR